MSHASCGVLACKHAPNHWAASAPASALHGVARGRGSDCRRGQRGWRGRGRNGPHLRNASGRSQSLGPAIRSASRRMSDGAAATTVRAACSTKTIRQVKYGYANAKYSCRVDEDAAEAQQRPGHQSRCGTGSRTVSRGTYLKVAERALGKGRAGRQGRPACLGRRCPKPVRGRLRCLARGRRWWHKGPILDVAYEERHLLGRAWDLRL